MTRSPTITVANEAELMAHLDARFSNGAVERALGGFGLLLLRMDGVRNAAATEARVTRTLRESDFLARIDDAHMAVVIPQVSDRETAQLVAEKLARALLPEYASRIAVGGALFPADASSRDALIDAATERIQRASMQTANAGIEV